MNESADMKALTEQLREANHEISSLREKVSEWQYKYFRLEDDYQSLRNDMENTLDSDAVFVEEIDRLREENVKLQRWKDNMLTVVYEE
jgi:chromosome segregation ATPase